MIVIYLMMWLGLNIQAVSRVHFLSGFIIIEPKPSQKIFHLEWNQKIQHNALHHLFS